MSISLSEIISPPISLTTGIWNFTWNYVRDNTFKYSLYSLFKDVVSENERIAYHKRSPRELFLMGSTESLKAFPLHVIFVLTSILTLIKLNKLSFKNKDETKENKLFNWSDYKIEMIIGGLIGPVLEELIFRGFTQSSLSPICGPYRAKIVTHLLFAWIHPKLRAINILFFNCAESSLYYRTGSIWASIGSHITNNSMAITIGAIAGFIYDNKQKKQVS